MKLFFHRGGCGDACCLRVQDLSVQIGSNQILKNVSMHVHCGQMVALIGPNGAGKSTLLKAILGQQEHTGEITFSAGGEKQALRIGYVPQSPSFEPGDCMSVLDLFACSISKRPAFLPPSKKLREMTLTVKAKGGGAGRLFGSVTNQEIADALAKNAGIKLDKRKIVIADAIKSVGTYTVTCKLGYEINAPLTVKIEEI